MSEAGKGVVGAAALRTGHGRGRSTQSSADPSSARCQKYIRSSRKEREREGETADCGGEEECRLNAGELTNVASAALSVSLSLSPGGMDDGCGIGCGAVFRTFPEVSAVEEEASDSWAFEVVCLVPFRAFFVLETMAELN